jgi:hypothetical protein
LHSCASSCASFVVVDDDDDADDGNTRADIAAIHKSVYRRLRSMIEAAEAVHRKDREVALHGRKVRHVDSS